MYSSPNITSLISGCQQHYQLEYLMNDIPIFDRVLEERKQGHSTRIELYKNLEDQLKVPVVSLFTSFRYPAAIETSDADMLEEILRKIDVEKGIALFLSSPGGSGLAAERIVNLCRSYSGTGRYLAIVPGKAKSAATIICFGADKIIMSKTSELGAIDPQIIVQEGEQTKVFSVHNIINSYTELFNKARHEKGNLQPFLQQLANYDSKEIEELKSEMQLSESMAIKILKSGMMKTLSEREIKKQIGIFLSPKTVKVHGRPIYAEEAKKSKLIIEMTNLNSDLWSLVHELYFRLNGFVSSDRIAKCIETKNESYHVQLNM